MRLMTSIHTAWPRSLWLGVLVAAGAVLTMAFACVTPFAAFAAIAAVTLSRRDAVLLAVALWLANQAVGYGVLHYSWSARSAAWGVAIGIAAVAGTIAAHAIFSRLRSLGSPARGLVAFVAAFTIYQLALFAAAASVLGGVGTFTPRIVGQVLLVNAVALVGLSGLDQLLGAVGALARRLREKGIPARFA